MLPLRFLKNSLQSDEDFTLYVINNKFMSQVTSISDSEFNDKVLSSEIPVLVDYWAPWCGPCKAIAPILDEIAQLYSAKLQVFKLNIDDNPTTPPKYNVRGIPTCMLFKNSQVEATKVGSMSKAALINFLDDNL